MKPGRKPDVRRSIVIATFGLPWSWIHNYHSLPRELVDQVYACKSNVARRLILDVSEKMEAVEQPTQTFMRSSIAERIHSREMKKRRVA